MAKDLDLGAPPDSSARPPQREVFVEAEGLKFSAAHFVAFRGFREALHGHNYTVALRVGGPKLGEDGHLVELGALREAARQVCRELNGRTLLPTLSDVLQVRPSAAAPRHLEVLCEGKHVLTVAAEDCVLLPIAHSTAEELAEHICSALLAAGSLAASLLDRGLDWIEVSVSERPGQAARFRRLLRSKEAAGAQHGRPERHPRPCLAAAVRPTAVSSPAETAALSLPSGLRRSVARDAVRDGEAAYRALLSTLGAAESGRPELAKTPHRAAKAWRELTSGYAVEDPLSVARGAVFDVEHARDLVAVRDIPFHSLCEHHLLPFSGVAHVAYFPEGRVLGLSKFARLLHVFTRRLQLQERITHQFAEAVEELLRPRAVAVSLEATHACMCMRGVGVPATTRTVALRGAGRDDKALREQLLTAVASRSTARL